ncbi:two-component regulator propeller domain-containing protein [Echinicola sp. 20G]|uniref:hybrid sensor histidine kinase/response regulator transcription factor n=1 Tax=Echinicola sp. 20G TaxID=2781961 RepID=UPI00191087D3|nr:two-component regulator propeller domain-containing protein [Echinicola sp. 20G]
MIRLTASFTLLFVLCSLFVLKGFSQTSNYLFGSISVDNGLSNNNVTDIYKDDIGYVWMATNSGLNRYDGRKFKVFKNEPNDTTSISENSIRRIMPGPDNQLWLLNRNNIFEVYLPMSESFESDLSVFASQYQLASENVNLVYRDKNSRFWFAHPNLGVSVYDPSDGKTTYLNHEEGEPYSLSFSYVSAIGNNSEGDIWLVYANGAIDILNGETFQVKRKIELFNNKKAFFEDDFEIFIDSDDDVWIYLYENGEGLFYYDHAANRLQQINTSSIAYQLNNNQVRGIIENKPGEIWVGTDHGGINIINKESKTISYVQHDAENPHSLAHNSVYALYKDDSDVVWVGTFKNGINIYNEKLIRFPHVKHMLTGNHSLPYNDINCFVEDEKGNFYLGTNGGGLVFYNRQTERYKEFKHDKNHANSLPGNIIVDMLMDRNGDLWIGTYLNGLSKFDGKTFTNYLPETGNSQSLSGESVWELYEDHDGNIWAGTLRSGLNLYLPDEDGFVHFGENEENYTMHCNYISSLVEDNQGNMWIGGGNGIDVINFKTGSAKYYNQVFNDSSSLVGNNVLDIFIDSKEKVWIATTQGLCVFHPESGGFSSFRTADGLPADHIFNILEDNNGHLWLSTTNGLSQTKVTWEGEKPKLEFRNFGIGDGLQGNSFNENSAMKTSRGELVFGGANGFNIFYPDRMQLNEESPKVVFTDFHLFNSRIPIGQEVDGRVLLKQSINDTGEIILKHHEDVFSIEFAALNFIHSDKNKYKYLLEGFDNDWVEINDGVTKVTYTNLDPGKYTFKVKAANNDGVWSDHAQVLNIEVLAPFWKTPLAFLLYFIVVSAIVILIQREIIAREKDKLLIEQDKVEAKRMQELDKMKTKFFTNVSHEFRTPLTLILAPIEKLLSTDKSGQNRHHYQTIHRNAKRLMNLINQLLDIRKIETNGLDFSPVEGDVINFLKEAVESFEDLSEKKNIGLSFESNVSSLFTFFDADKLEKIVFNLLSNAFKFTYREGQISVSAQYEKGENYEGILHIAVRDTGVGMSKEVQQRIFDRFYVGEENSDSLNQGSGIGLSIVQEFTRMHGGQVQLESELGKGSNFIISLPLEELSPIEEPLMDHEEEEQLSVELTEMKTILLVEDNEDFLLYLKSCLSEEYKVITALNGEEGLEVALEHIPDLVISDVMMPKMNGLALCHTLKKDRRTSHIPVILLTAKTSEEHQLEGLDSGANHYVTKPFKIELLLLRIRNLLEERSLLQERFKKRIGVITSEEKLESLDDILIQKAVRVVEDNIDDPEFSVEFLSKELAMSRVHLYKKLSSLTGKKPLEFIRMIRLERATQLLGESQLNVAEVAYRVGYNNAKYFTKHFKAEYKVLPSVYAQRKVELAEQEKE